MIQKLFFLFVIACFPIFSEEPIIPYLTSECDALALVEGVVNAFNGKLVQVERDIEIEGSDPLDLTRYYDGGHHFYSELGYGVGYGYPIWLEFHQHKDRGSILVEMRKGCNVLFEVKGEKQKGGHKYRFRGKVDPDYFKTGYTNSPEALMNGEPSLSSMSVEGDENEFVVKMGNGAKRHYQFYEVSGKKKSYYLTLEERANGNRRHFFYIDRGDQHLLQRIATNNSDDTLLLNAIDFEYQDNRVKVVGSNEQIVYYSLQRKQGTAKRSYRIGNPNDPGHGVRIVETI